MSTTWLSKASNIYLATSQSNVGGQLTLARPLAAAAAHRASSESGCRGAQRARHVQKPSRHSGPGTDAWRTVQALRRTLMVIAGGFCRGDDVVFVLHEANVSSGGMATRIELPQFL